MNEVYLKLEQGKEINVDARADHPQAQMQNRDLRKID
jgi:hypothetical protein